MHSFGKKLDQYVLFLIDAYEKFVILYNLPNEQFMIDKILLRDAAIRYIKDVDRIYLYHNIDKIDAHKIAGYLTYWICELKPIHVTNDAYKENITRDLYINEYFAVFVSVARILASKHYSDGKIVKIEFSQSFFESFMYTLRYRQTTGDNLAIIYYLIDCINMDKG